MIYLVFNAKSDADIVQEKISENMGLGLDSEITTAYAIPKQTLLGSWAFIKPEDRYMNGVVNYSEVNDPEFSAAIFD
jgi:hypothetical protein